MARMGAIQRALVDRLREIPDFEAYSFVPDSVNAPCAFVRPATPFVDYQIVMGGNVKAVWRFVLTILVNRIDEEAAQEALDEYIDPAGPIVGAIHKLLEDDLADVADYANVTRGDRYGDFRVGSVDYFGAQLTVEVMA